jgi:cytochrome c553
MQRILIIAVLALVSQPDPGFAADVKRGEQLAQQQCAACHGKDFVTTTDPTYPKLAGQYVDYLEKALRDYQTGARKNAIMAGLAKPLSRDDVRNLAAYIAGLPGPLSNEKR